MNKVIGRSAALLLVTSLAVGCCACSSHGDEEPINIATDFGAEEQTASLPAPDAVPVSSVNKDKLSGFVNLVKNFNYEGISNAGTIKAPLAAAEAVLADDDATQEEADMAYTELKTAFDGLGDSSPFTRINKLDKQNGYPDPFVFSDGRIVDSAEDWSARADELSRMYEYYMYGYWRSGEKVTYSISDTGATIVSFFGTVQAPEAKKLTVSVTVGDRSISFDAPVFLPDPDKCPVPEGGYPYIVCMHDIEPRKTALEQGYAVIILNTTDIAQDNNSRAGKFYELYPYSKNADDQTGVLMAWSWGASKVLDAIYAGADKDFNLNADYSLVTGVSRWGKATAVCGAFEKRFKMVIPSCSGAGGLALYRYMSEGRTYDFSSKDAPAEYTYGANEPIGSLTSSGERGWFNTGFVSFTDPDRIPLEQYMLAGLCADPDRYYMVIGSCISEDWVNAPSMWACYKAASKIYRFLGLEDHFICNIHKEGHAVIEEDMLYIISYFNKMVRGIDDGTDFSVLHTSIFELEVNKDSTIDEIGSDWKH